MRHVSRLLFAPLLLLLAAACEPKLEAPTPEGEVMSADMRLADVASRGDGRNPFSVAVMREALRNLRRPGGPPTKAPGSMSTAGEDEAHRGALIEPEVPMPCRGCEGDPVIQPTHTYVRYRPNDPDQLADLADAGLELSLEPLDESVAASTPPADPTAEQIPWLYTAVPTDVPLPANVQNIPQERIAELFLFTPEDGDIADEDPWEPQPPIEPQPCEPQWDPSCRCYIPCAQERTAQRTRRNRTREATERLKKAGISPRALYNEAMRLTLHADELLDEPAAAGSLQARYNPSGTILVEERTGLGTGRGAVPLRGVTVFARRWFNLFANGQTNQNGQFYISRNFRKKARVIVEFKNSRVTTRGLSPAMKPWGLVLPIRHELGHYTRTDMENLRYTFSYQGNVDSKGALSWSAATLFNSVDDMYTSCAAAGIPNPPAGLNVMLLSHLAPSAAAPMLRYLTETSTVSAIIDQLLTPTGVLLKRVVQRQLPDVVCRYGFDNTRTTDDLDESFFHELGHSVHYRQVGNLYWTGYIALIVEATAKRVLDKSRTSIYGRKTDDGAGLISISEGWGNYIGNTFTARKYDGIDPTIATANRRELENQTPDDNPDNDDSWIVYGMLHDMMDNTIEPIETGVTDNVTSYTTQQIYRGLQPDITGVRQYQQRVLAQNNNRQLTEMNQLLTSYRW